MTCHKGTPSNYGKYILLPCLHGTVIKAKQWRGEKILVSKSLYFQARKDNLKRKKKPAVYNSSS